MLDFETKYKAILDKDASYEGVFFMAVKSTGIFCRPVCTARKPKPENVIFYNTTKEAILNGFRPCKVCKPMENSGETPDYINEILQELHKEPYVKIKDYDLKLKGIEPSHIRRWFKKHHKITFHSYQRLLRINSAYKKIAMGTSVTHAAFDSGYESLSGFNDSYFTVFGHTPSKSKDQVVINMVRFTTPLGAMFACATAEGICLLEFTDRKMLETEFRSLCKLLKAVILPGSNTHLEQIQFEIAEYFDGKRIDFSVPLHTPGTGFQRDVWKKLLEIPYGETRSYKQQAVLLGKPDAVRAVANANGFNRVAIIIPCHRVIGENGKLTGYAGGLARKQWLLDFEKKNSGKELQGKLIFE